jgi:hypothetical protein
MDPNGTLAISDGSSTITIEPTYFDSWLTALIESLSRLKSNNHVFVEVQEEPKPLQIDVAADGSLVISHEGHKVIAGGRKEFEVALRTAVNAFLEAISDCPDSAQNRNIDPIRRFWATTQN